MPDIDRNALDEALAVHVHKNTGQAPHHPQTGWAPNYCGSLDASVSALIALGLSWGVATGPNPISCAFVTDGVKSCEVPSTDDSSAALATALVQAALEVLKSEEESNG